MSYLVKISFYESMHNHPSIYIHASLTLARRNCLSLPSYNKMVCACYISFLKGSKMGKKSKKRIYLGLPYHFQIFFKQFCSSLVSNGLHTVTIHEKAANRKHVLKTISYHNQFNGSLMQQYIYFDPYSFLYPCTTC